MYYNLEAEIARKGIKKKNIAKILNIQLSTLSVKLSGKSDIKLREALMIKSILDVDIPLEELFKVN